MIRFKSVALTAIMTLSSALVMADYNPSTNNSATQMKTGNRNATTGAEAAFYNPAGTVLGNDGLTLELSLMPFSSSQEVYDSEFDKTYTSATSSALYPAFNFTYKKNKLAVFGNMGITNGGGAGDYQDGLPMFERLGTATMYSAIMAGTPGFPSNNPFSYNYSSPVSFTHPPAPQTPEALAWRLLP